MPRVIVINAFWHYCLDGELAVCPIKKEVDVGKDTIYVIWILISN